MILLRGRVSHPEHLPNGNLPQLLPILVDLRPLGVVEQVFAISCAEALVLALWLEELIALFAYTRFTRHFQKPPLVMPQERKSRLHANFGVGGPRCQPVATTHPPTRKPAFYIFGAYCVRTLSVVGA